MTDKELFDAADALVAWCTSQDLSDEDAMKVLGIATIHFASESAKTISLAIDILGALHEDLIENCKRSFDAANK